MEPTVKSHTQQQVERYFSDKLNYHVEFVQVVKDESYQIDKYLYISEYWYRIIFYEGEVDTIEIDTIDMINKDSHYLNYVLDLIKCNVEDSIYKYKDGLYYREVIENYDRYNEHIGYGYEQVKQRKIYNKSSRS